MSTAPQLNFDTATLAAPQPRAAVNVHTRSMHGLGVVCGLAAGAWLGAAEAPTKLAGVGLSPFIVSLGMVCGVFAARWTLPVLAMGSGRLMDDLRARPHLIVWAVLAGMLWVVANTLTIFAIRDVGLAVAFPLWNINSLVGLGWAWLLFGELRGAGKRLLLKVAGGSLCIAVGAALLAGATAQQAAHQHQALTGTIAALGAGLLWGTMYIPYRKAYLSGMNPLSFVTVFTIGELLAMAALAAVFLGGPTRLAHDLLAARPAMLWLFLGGFCWVIGDLFQQYAAKYIGISRGIPLSNTNQLWGLAWGALVFAELGSHTALAQTLILAGSSMMIAGAIFLSRAEENAAESLHRHRAIRRECLRYGLPDPQAVALGGTSAQHAATRTPLRRWWDAAFVVPAIALFVGLAWFAKHPPLRIDWTWAALLAAACIAVFLLASRLLWKRTRFS